MRFIVAALIVVLLSGCASFTAPARKHELDSSKSYWMDYDVSRRGTIVANTSSTWQACAEPAPDAAIGIVAKLEGSLNVAGQGNAEGKGDLTQSVVNLAEKTQMVLFLRESLFRLCELTINTGLDAATAEELYKTVINAALELVKKEQAEIALEQKRLESADQSQFIWEYLNKRNVDPEIIQSLLRDLP